MILCMLHKPNKIFIMSDADADADSDSDSDAVMK